MRYIDEGVPVLYNGPHVQRIYKNWKSTEVFRNDVVNILCDDIAKGRKSGPFQFPPVPNFIGSPMGAFRKRHSQKIRIIHDLSWCPKMGVNNFIDKSLCSVQYVSIDSAIDLIKKAGSQAQMSKIDLQDAYKSIVVRPADWHLLGSSWTDDLGNIWYFIDHVLPFGLRSSAMLFNLFASALEMFILNEGCSSCIHYLDDYFTVGKEGTEECSKNLEVMLKVCSETGVAVNYSKVVEPTKEIEFLGIILDSVKMEARISDERMQDVLSELNKWSNKRRGKKRELLSLLGKLVFISRIIRPGRIFMRRLFDIAKQVRNLNQTVRISNDAHGDIKWWLYTARTWNKKCIFYEDGWRYSIDLFLANDASDWGCGGVFKTRWFMFPWSKEEKKMTIAWREMLAILWACALWGPNFIGKRIIIFCDNQSIVFSVNNGSCKCPEIMSLIRALYHICVKYNFECKLRYIASLANKEADALSRNNIQEFLKLVPNANALPDILCDKFVQNLRKKDQIEKANADL